MATESPDLFEDQGKSWSQEFVEQFEGKDITLTRNQMPSMTVESIRATRTMAFTLPNVRAANEDLFVSLRLEVEPLKGYPARIARRVYVTAKPSATEQPASREFTWANSEPFTATFYFKNVGPGPVDLGFEVEGGQPVTFLELTAHSATDARYREFDNGVVFANPSTRPYTFDLAMLFPGASFRRIQGHSDQDPAANSGQPLGDKLTLAAKDGLFVSEGRRVDPASCGPAVRHWNPHGVRLEYHRPYPIKRCSCG